VLYKVEFVTNTLSNKNNETFRRDIMSYVQYIWILLSILISVTCSFCFLQPEWIVQLNYKNCFGIYSFCVRSRNSEMSRVCGIYGGQFGFGNIPSSTWQAACLLYGGGCLFTCFGALCSLATMCVRSTIDRTLMLSTRYLQISSGEFATISIHIVLVDSM